MRGIFTSGKVETIFTKYSALSFRKQLDGFDKLVNSLKCIYFLNDRRKRCSNNNNNNNKSTGKFIPY